MKIETKNINEVVIVNSDNKVIAMYNAKKIGCLDDSIDPQLIIEILNETKTSNESEVCIIHGCNKPVYKRGVCKKHFKDYKL